MMTTSAAGEFWVEELGGWGFGFWVFFNYLGFGTGVLY